MRKIAVLLIFALGFGQKCLAQNTEPVYHLGWYCLTNTSQDTLSRFLRQCETMDCSLENSVWRYDTTNREHEILHIQGYQYMVIVEIFDYDKSGKKITDNYILFHNPHTDTWYTEALSPKMANDLFQKTMKRLEVK